MKNPIPKIEMPEIIRRIEKQAARLVMPDLKPLQKLLIDQLYANREEVRRLERKRMCIAEEGRAAATRLLLSPRTTLEDFNKPYFSQIEKKRGH